MQHLFPCTSVLSFRILLATLTSLTLVSMCLSTVKLLTPNSARQALLQALGMYQLISQRIKFDPPRICTHHVLDLQRVNSIFLYGRSLGWILQ